MQEDEIYWHRRGDFIPHFDKSGKYQMITYRLNDSLPKKVLDEFETLNNTGETPVLPERDLERRKLIEKYLDKGYGSCVLRRPEIAKLVVDAWKFFDKERYDLIAYVVMPNHVHVLIKTYEGHSLTDVIHSWKSYTGHEMKKILERDKFSTGGTPVLPGWQIEYWDRFIRDSSHYKRAIKYIHENPVKAGLCSCAEDWTWSSARDFEESEDEK